MISSALVNEPKKNGSEICVKYKKAIEKTFKGYILPRRSEGFTSFIKDNVPMYVGYREWEGGINDEYALQRFYAYEDAINNYFWEDNRDSEKEYAKPLLILSGARGVGKSTLIQYYLRCYCPEKKPHNHSFEKKLIIYFDAKSCIRDDLFKAFFMVSIDNSIKEFSLTYENNPDPLVAIFNALKELSDYAKNNDKYLVLCLDNIDQCPNDVQEYAFAIIHRLVEDPQGIHVYKIIFPVWPKTFHVLKRLDRFNIRSEKYYKLNLGKVNSRKMILKRVSHAKRIVREMKINSGNEDFFRHIKNLISRLDNSDIEFISNITNGDNKRTLKLLSDIVCSRDFEEYQNRYPNKTYLWKYELIDILLCGEFEYHNDYAIILNIYNPLGRVDTLNDYFLGPYAISLLGKHESIAKTEFFEIIKSYGFHLDKTTELVTILQDRNMFHYSDPAQSIMIVHRSVLEAYNTLILNAAYIDNMAIVTPVAKEYKEKMKLTKGYDRKQFTARVESTLQFITMLCNAESTLRKNNDCSSISWHWKLVSDKYFTRLEKLRSDKRYLSGVVGESDTWWTRILGSKTPTGETLTLR